MKKELEGLADSPIFRGMTGEERERAAALLRGRLADYPKGVRLAHPGQVLTAFGVVCTGQILIQREDFWGGCHILSTQGPGELFGETYALQGVPLLPAVLAAADSRVLWLSAAPLTEAGGDLIRDRLTANLLRVLSAKNFFLTRKIDHITRKTTREKLLSYLSAEGQRAGSPRFAIPLDRQQLADYLGVERSALSAELGKLRREGVLSCRKNQFELLEPMENGT